MDLAEFYQRHESKFRPKGLEEHQDPCSLLNELAVIGDKYLSYILCMELITLNFTAGEMSVAVSQHLSNASFARLAKEFDLPTIGSNHSVGTLLEAMVAYWVLAENHDYEIYSDGVSAFKELFAVLVSRSINSRTHSDFTNLFS